MKVPLHVGEVFVPNREKMEEALATASRAILRAKEDHYRRSLADIPEWAWPLLVRVDGPPSIENEGTDGPNAKFTIEAATKLAVLITEDQLEKANRIREHLGMKPMEVPQWMMVVPSR